VSGRDLNEAVCSLRQGMTAVAERRCEVGFSASSETDPVPAFLNRTEQGDAL